MYKPHTICRACENDQLVEVFDLGIQPLANAFTLPGAESPGYAPLKVLFCPRCTLSQLSVVVRPDILYSNYHYVTSRSRTMQDHFAELWAEIINQQHCVASVVEIGSNDGHFLQFCKERGVEAVVGIDPAENLKPSTSDTGIFSICGLFDAVSANIARTSMPGVDVIVARHVFAHVDDWQGFVKNLDVLAGKETLIVIEVPDVSDLLSKVELDTIYHEHLSYVSVESVRTLLEHTPFHIHDVKYFPIHGGAMVLMLRRNDSSVTPNSPGYRIINQEMWQIFKSSALSSISLLKLKVLDLIRSGKSVCGFGASAKSTVWISACGFSRKEIKFICDCTPQKQGRLSPGTDITIVPESALMERWADYYIIWAWNFAPEIITRNKAYLEAGGHFIIPGKKIEIV